MFPSSSQRHLNFNKFLEDRAQEISKFREVLKLDTKKKGHQGLPKSIRRRAMSHNRYRIPSKMRKIHEQQLIKNQNIQKLPKCRKHIRKNHRLILSYKQRFSKTQWLSTHIWSAKRMRMISYYGYKIGYKPNDKCFRSSYRHFKHNCCLVDLSYYQCIEVKCLGEKQRVNRRLPENFRYSRRQDQEGRLEKKSPINLQSLSQEKVSQQISLFDNQNNLICPLMVFKCDDSTIRAFFHPCAKDQVNKLKQTFSPELFQVSVGKVASQLYCLIGPQWANKVMDAIRQYGIEITTDNGSGAGVLKFAHEKVSCFGTEGLEKGKEQQSNGVKVPKVTARVPEISNNVNPEQEAKLSYNRSMSEQIREQTQKLYAQLLANSSPLPLKSKSKADQTNISKFWSLFYSTIKPHSQNINFTITNRSKYTHRRKNKLSKQNKKKYLHLEKQKRQLLNQSQEDDSMSHEQRQESIQQIKNQIKEFHIVEGDIKRNKKIKKQEQQKGQKMQIEKAFEEGIEEEQVTSDMKSKRFEVNPVLVAGVREQKSNGGYMAGYILCSDNDNCRFWRILTHLNVKVIGLQEYRHILLQSEKRSFPEDYPQTLSFKTWAKQQALNNFQKIKYRPYQKRIDYLRIHSPNPFNSEEPQIISSKKIVSVFIEMVSKGRCLSGSYIYKLEDKDIRFALQELQERQKVSIVVKEEKGQQKSERSVLDYREGYDKICQKLLLNGVNQCQRQLIGRITSGGVLYSKSREGGIGYVDSSSIYCQNEEVAVKQTSISTDKKSAQRQLINDGYVLIRRVSSPYYYLGKITRTYQ